MTPAEIIEGIKDKSYSGDVTSGGADQIMLREWISTIDEITSALLGFVVVIVVLTVPIITMLEVLYILFPAVRDVSDGFASKLEKISVRTSKATQGTIGFVFRDARKAVVEAETVKTGRSALGIYLVNKCKSLMFMMFMIALVLMGFGTIIDFIASLFSGFIGLLLEVIIA